MHGSTEDVTCFLSPHMAVAFSILALAAKKATPGWFRAADEPRLWARDRGCTVIPCSVFLSHTQTQTHTQTDRWPSLDVLLAVLLGKCCCPEDGPKWMVLCSGPLGDRCRCMDQNLCVPGITTQDPSLNGSLGDTGLGSWHAL